LREPHKPVGRRVIGTDECDDGAQDHFVEDCCGGGGSICSDGSYELFWVPCGEYAGQNGAPAVADEDAFLDGECVEDGEQAVGALFESDGGGQRGGSSAAGCVDEDDPVGWGVVLVLIAPHRSGGEQAVPEHHWCAVGAAADSDVHGPEGGGNCLVHAVGGPVIGVGCHGTRLFVGSHRSIGG
jgi:hypothetical protein